MDLCSVGTFLWYLSNSVLLSGYLKAGEGQQLTAVWDLTVTDLVSQMNIFHSKHLLNVICYVKDTKGLPFLCLW